MNYSAIFWQHHNELPRPVVAMNGVTVLERGPSHRSSRAAQSPHRSSNHQSDQRLQAVAPAQIAGRRVGAGAGATPATVAMIRHDTSLVRWRLLVGRSRTCPSSLIANPIAIRIRQAFISKE